MRCFAFVLLLAIALCPAATARTGEGSALVLLADGHLLRVGIPSGHVLARRQIGPATTGSTEWGRMLAVAGGRVYALVPGRPAAIVAADAHSVKVLWRRELVSGSNYRGLLIAADRLYAYGFRPGRVVDRADQLTENSAVLTAIATDGSSAGSWTVRAADGHSWWEWWGAASGDGLRLALAWHGGCGGDSTDLCTTGADVLDLAGGAPRGCAPKDERPIGCSPDVHGAIESYGGGWIATTGGEPILVLDAGGRLTRTLHSGFQHEHLMSFAPDISRGRLLVLGTCFGGQEGLRTVSLASGSSRLVRRAVCGSDPVLGPGGTLLAILATDALSANVLAVLDRSSGRRLLRGHFASGILAVHAVP